MAICADEITQHGELIDWKDAVDKRVQRWTPNEKPYYVRLRMYPIDGSAKVFASGFDPHKDPEWFDKAVAAAQQYKPAEPWRFEILYTGGSGVEQGVALPPLLEAIETIMSGRMTQAKVEGDSAALIATVDANTRLCMAFMAERTSFMTLYTDMLKKKFEVQGDLSEAQLALAWGNMDDPEDPESAKWRHLSEAFTSTMGGAMKPLGSLGKYIDLVVAEKMAEAKKQQGDQGPTNGAGTSPPPAQEQPTKDPASKEPESDVVDAEEVPEEPMTDDGWADMTVEGLAAILADKPELLTPERLEKLIPHADKLARAAAILEQLAAAAEAEKDE